MNMNGYIHVNMDEKLRDLLKTIFTDTFMQENTNFQKFEDFQFSSAVIANWDSSHMVYAELLMDSFVKESTRFESWNEMVKTAADQKFDFPQSETE